MCIKLFHWLAVVAVCIRTTSTVISHIVTPAPEPSFCREWKQTNNSHAFGETSLNKPQVSVSECLEACWNDTRCYSVDYEAVNNNPNDYCWLINTENAALYPATGVTHYELITTLCTIAAVTSSSTTTTTTTTSTTTPMTTTKTSTTTITDINECNTSTHGCQHTCVNTPGSYHCSCLSGYNLIGNGKNCIDIDECITSTHGCQQNCTNTPGSYRCSCLEGYTLDTNGQLCSDVDECATNGICPESTVCENTVGSFVCIKYRDNKAAFAAAVALGVCLLIVAVIAVIIIVILLSRNRALTSQNQSQMTSQNLATGQESQYYNSMHGENRGAKSSALSNQNENGYMELAINVNKKSESEYEGLKM